jgi:hypothetical protein
MRVLHDAPHRLVTRPALSRIQLVRTVPRTVLPPSMPQAIRKDAPLALSRPEPSQRPAPRICAEERVDGLPRAHAMCSARLLLAQQAGDDALRDDWRVYRALAELGMEERAQGGWCVTPPLCLF